MSDGQRAAWESFQQRRTEEGAKVRLVHVSKCKKLMVAEYSKGDVYERTIFTAAVDTQGEKIRNTNERWSRSSKNRNQVIYTKWES